MEPRFEETNANVLSVGQPLTAGQITALAELELRFMERMSYDADTLENVRHEFMRVMMGSCCCREPRDV